MNPSPSTRRVPPSNPLTASNDVKRQSAAFQGATHAFSRSPVAEQSSVQLQRDANGVFTAASSADAEPSGREMEAGVVPSDQRRLSRPMITRSRTSDMSMRQSSQSREQSPSHVAALLATSRASPTRVVSGSSTPRLRQPSPLHSLEDLKHAESVDRVPIGDTNSLVKLFESKEKSDAPVTQSVRYSTKPILPMKKPLPIQPSTTSSLSTAGTRKAKTQAPMKPESNSLHTSKATYTSAGTHQTTAPSSISSRPTPETPVPARSEKRPPLDDLKAASEAPTSREKPLGNAPKQIEPTSARPTLPKRHTNSTATPSPINPATASRPSLVPAQTSDTPLPNSAPLTRKLTRISSTHTPQLTVDSLANAMVASSLASSRAPSPSKPPPIPPPRRHNKHSLFRSHPSQDPISRDPSPQKGMRQTMREPKSSSSEDERYRRKRGYNKHAHKHHEGDRKRYRTQITERERKRYEGVWAANKGLFLPQEYQYSVINIVVRDIWKRSRLPDDVLEEVWELVDGGKVGRLEREEFVVGMWLIDQRLKGNKLPMKVQESVWASVRRLQGIKVPMGRR